MGEKMTREDVVRMARAARLAEPSLPFNPTLCTSSTPLCSPSAFLSSPSISPAIKWGV